MFEFLRKGVKVYKGTLAEHIKESNRVVDLAKQSSGDHYGGFVSWPRGDRECFSIRESQLYGMARALGLSDEEKKKILKSVEKKLGMKNPSLDRS